MNWDRVSSKSTIKRAILKGPSEQKLKEYREEYLIKIQRLCLFALFTLVFLPLVGVFF